MKTRIISALIMLPLLVVVYIRGPLLWALAFAIAVMGVTELYKGFENKGIKPCKIIGIGSIVGLYAVVVWAGEVYFYTLWLALTLIACFLMLFKEGFEMEDSMATLLGIIYLGLLSAHIVLLDQTSKGAMVFAAILIAVGTDVFAYFTGLLLGRHKLCPSISPKKTVEGALGGLVGSVVFCSLFGFLVFGESIWHFVIIGLLGSIVAQIGDLSASIFKRKMGIKDFGNLIPGHGGILDRFDSLLFTATFVYYYVIFIM